MAILHFKKKLGFFLEKDISSLDTPSIPCQTGIIFREKGRRRKISYQEEIS